MAGFDALLSMARDNDAAGIKSLIQSRCPPSFSNRVGQTAMHIAAIWGSMDAMKALLEAGGDPNATNNLRGSTPLHAIAMGRGPVEQRVVCARLLIMYKADPRKPDMGGDLPLQQASEEEIVQVLGGAPLVLHKAVQSHKLDSVHAALLSIRRDEADGIELDTTNPSGETALHLAVSSGWREGLEVLLEARADPCLPNHMQRAPLHTAVLAGDHLSLRKLLEFKAEVNATDRDPDHDPRFSSKSFEETPQVHRTALHYAASLGNVLAAKGLLEAWADPNAVDAQRQTPLHLTLALRDSDYQLEVGSGVKVVGLLKRPDWNSRLGAIIGPQGVSDDGSAARWPVLLDGDAKAGVLLKEENLQLLSEEIVDVLLKAHADVNLGSHVTGESRTLLHEASRLGDVPLAQKLIAARAEVNHQDSKLGMSALHLAARAKKLELAKLLIESAADLELKTVSGKTAAELASTNGASQALVAILKGEAEAVEEAPVKAADPLAALTPEQRALLFID